MKKVGERLKSHVNRTKLGDVFIGYSKRKPKRRKTFTLRFIKDNVVCNFTTGKITDLYPPNEFQTEENLFEWKVLEKVKAKTLDKKFKCKILSKELRAKMLNKRLKRRRKK